MRKVSISDLVKKPISGAWGKEAENGDVGIPVIRNTNFTDEGRIDLHDVAYRVIKDRKIEKKRLEYGDIIIEKSGGSKNQPVGRVVYFDIDDSRDYLYSNFTSALKVKDGIEPKYVHYGLHHSYLRGGSELFQNKTTGIRNLQLRRYLDKIEIPLPPLDEQKAIVAKLDRAQRLIDIDRAMLAKYDELIQSVFLEMFGDPVTNPKGWEKVKMKEISKINRGGSPRPINEYLGGTVPWIKISDGTKGDDLYIKSTKEHIIEEGIKKSRLLKPGSLILANSGVSLGFARIIKIKGCIHDGWLSIANINKDKVSSVFLLKQLNQLTGHFRNTAPDGTQPNLNTTIIKNFNIIVPPMQVQEDFVNLVLKIRDETDSVNQSLVKSTNLFSSLLQQAFG